MWCVAACGDVVVATEAAFNHCHILSSAVRERLSPAPPASCLELPTSTAHAFSPAHDACEKCQSAGSTCDHRHHANITHPLTSSTPPLLEAVRRWCRRGLRGHFQVAEVVGTMSSTRILVFVRLGKYVSCRDGLIDRGRRPLCDTQIHIPRFGAVRAAASCDSFTPPTRVRGTTRTGPLGSSDGRQSPSIAAPKAMPFAGASSHPVVPSECIPVAQTTPRCENAVMNTHRRSRTRGTKTCRQVLGWGRMDQTDGKDGTSWAAA